MTFSPTAIILRDAIDASDLIQREIADRAGFRHANIMSMMKTGDTRVPRESIPARARALDIEERHFLIISIQEYRPGVHEVLVDDLGLPLADAELGILTMYRMARRSTVASSWQKRE